ncbi:MAG: acyltransferase [Phycisphaerae bacterium]|nr:acyltransferase [Phycisphaerae bacterium]
MRTTGPSLTETESFLRQWDAAQVKYGDMPGEDGARKRADAYAPFFLRFGDRVFISPGCRFYHPHRITLEDDVRFNEGALVYGSGGVHFGRHARIGPRFFVHSANHEIAPSPLAFHERSYDYATVRIGDNCLISANVTMLPGTSLGPGSFVAAGAVVTGKAYPDDARLAGVPARAMLVEGAAATANPAPVVMVVGKRGDRRTEALRRIVAALGLPQVCVGDESDAGTTVRHILRLQDRSAARAGKGSLTEWSLQEGAATTGAQCELDVGNHVRFLLSRTRSLTVAPAKGNAPRGAAVASNRILADAANMTLYNALKRLRKRKRELSDEVDVLLAALVLSGSERGDFVVTRDRLLEVIKGERAEASLASATKAIGAGGSRNPVVPALLSRMKLAAGVKTRIESAAGPSARDVAAAPELLPLMACRVDTSDAPSLAQIATDLVESSDKAWAVACVAAFAHLCGLRPLFERSIERLLAPDLFDDHVGCVRSAASATSGYAYAALVGAVLAVHASTQAKGFRIELECDRVSTLQLGVVGEAAGAPVSIIGAGALVCPVGRAISAGLVDAWIDSIAPPAIANGQLELTLATYEPVVPALLAAWRSAFRHMILSAGEPFIEVLPWPDGREAAVSVRYDIDRATLAGQVRRIVEIQQRSFGGPCGSWYAIPGTEHGRKIEGTLHQHLQEIGVHGLRSDHAEAAGFGVTMHSAPGSEYWRGEHTLAGQASVGATYTELLSTATDRPMPAWLVDAKGASVAGELWTTPLHFPLEGSTNDTDLSYFDRLRSRFREVIRRGGHAIIGSHPDLNQEILAKLAREESLDRCWCATVGEVVERCRRLYAVGAIEAVQIDGDPRPHLRARRNVADVAIRIERSAGDTASIRIVQLNAGQPRPLELTS